jgi:hypothetical protein
MLREPESAEGKRGKKLSLFLLNNPSAQKISRLLIRSKKRRAMSQCLKLCVGTQRLD